MLMLVLVACGPSAGSDDEQRQETADVPVQATESATATAASGEPEGQITPSSTVAADETSIGELPPDQVSIVRAQDHVIGAAEPLISIIEYGDFQ
jgi:hypothetical protein